MKVNEITLQVVSLNDFALKYYIDPEELSEFLGLPIGPTYLSSELLYNNLSEFFDHDGFVHFLDDVPNKRDYQIDEVLDFLNKNELHFEVDLPVV